MKKCVQILVIVMLSLVCSPISNALNSEKRAVVFIAGIDKDNNTYYKNAEAYFNTSNYEVVTNLYALADILDWIRLHYDETIYNDIHIVSHSNPWFGLSLKTTSEGERITEKVLLLALKHKEIVPLEKHKLSKDVNIIFHSCGLGKNEALLILLKKAFTLDTAIPIYASKLFNVFGGKYEDHYLAKTYYGYYPTAQSPGPRQLATEFKNTFPNVDADWEKVLKTRTEQLRGDMYTFKFNIPVEWEFEFENTDDIPKFASKEAIMEWVLEIDELRTTIEAFQIPIEKFRWLSTTKGNTLYIKGKSTVLCVLQPIINGETTSCITSADFRNQYYTKL